MVCAIFDHKHVAIARYNEHGTKANLLFSIYFFGASEATIFSKRGSRRNGSQSGKTFQFAVANAGWVSAESSSCLMAESLSPPHA